MVVLKTKMVSLISFMTLNNRDMEISLSVHTRYRFNAEQQIP